MHKFRKLSVVGAAAALATVGLVALAPGASPQTEAGSQAFSTVGEHTFTVPAGVTSVTVEAFGAEGGDGGSCTSGEFCVAAGGTGGRGARVTTTLAVAPGETLSVVVGGAGEPGADLAGGVAGSGYGAGGDGGASGNDADGSTVSAGGGGGGGASAVVRAGAALVVAAGGGGGGGEGANAGSEPDRGGDGGTSGAAGSGGQLQPCAGGGGDAATDTAGGEGGSGGTTDPPVNCDEGGLDGADGAAALGGAGGQNPLQDPCGAGGGGGGGGLFGGGGGGTGGENEVCASAGGGGGGSSLSTGGLLEDGVRSGDGQVTISWIAAIVAEPSFTG